MLTWNIPRRLLSMLLVIGSLTTTAPGLSVLWEKTITAEHASRLILHLGSDGSVAVADGVQNVQKIYWYDRSGNLIAEVVPKHPNVFGFAYASKDELIAMYMIPQSPNGGVEIFQRTDRGEIEHTTVTTPMGGFSDRTFSYPYLLEAKGSGSTYQIKLIDLTSSTAPSIVGDAVIGVKGKNLQIRWKSISTAKYKVQFSADLETWEDYSDIMDGTGSTVVVNIPLVEDVTLYARVVKL